MDVILWSIIFVLFFSVCIELSTRILHLDCVRRFIFRKTKQPKQFFYTQEGLKYCVIGDEIKPALVMIHGAPGSLLKWRKMIENPLLYKKYKVILVDRAGYAGSRKMGVERSVLEHAQNIERLLEKEAQPVVLFGHSYGAPIALVVAALCGDKIKFVGASAGQYYARYEKIFWISYVIQVRVFAFLLPRFLWTVNEEKLHHKNALDAIEGYYGLVKCPVYLFHTTGDMIVPYANSYALHAQLKNSFFETIESKRHGMIFTHVEVLQKPLLEA
jgi:pimeloyl-ACP methyl ester carboxylesterase